MRETLDFFSSPPPFVYFSLLPLAPPRPPPLHLSPLPLPNTPPPPPLLSITRLSSSSSLFSSPTSSPSYFLSSSSPSLFLPSLTQEAVISERSGPADIFHGTSLISTRRPAIGCAGAASISHPIPFNQEASQPADPRVNQLQIAIFFFFPSFLELLRWCLLYISAPCRLLGSLQACRLAGRRDGWRRRIKV